MTDLNRTLRVYVDGIEISQGCRVLLQGAAALSLYPSMNLVGLLNLSDAGYNALADGRTISVATDRSELFTGQIQDFSRRPFPGGGVLTEIGFSLGLDLWQAEISFSVPAGKTVEEIIRLVLEASGTPFRLLTALPSSASFGLPAAPPSSTFFGLPAPQPSSAPFSRPWALFGRAGELLETLLSSAGLRGCLTPAGLLPVHPSTPPQAELSEADLTDRPILTRGYAVLQTRPLGWPVGRRASLMYQGRETTGLILRREIDADTAGGPWSCQLLLEL